MALRICESYRKQEYGPYGMCYTDSEDVAGVAREIEQKIEQEGERKP
jgi:hypothetical protein